MCLIRVRAELCRNGPDLRIPGIADILFLFADDNNLSMNTGLEVARVD